MAAAEKTKVVGVAGPVLVGMMIFFMFLAASNVARSILDEDVNGTLPRLFTTPTPRGVILAGKFLSVMLVVLIQAVVLIVAGRLIFGIDWGGPAPVGALTVVGAAVAAGFAVCLMSLARTPGQAGAITSGVFLVMALVGGNFVGTANPGGIFGTVRLFTPNGWLLKGWDSTLRGGSIGDVLLPVVVVLAFAIVTLSIGSRPLPEAVLVRYIWTLATKDLLQTRRDRMAALFTIILPIAFTVFFGLLFGGLSSGIGTHPPGGGG